MTDPIFSASAKKNTQAIQFVLLMGGVSFFADITYEGARSITGPFFAVLGAHAALVGFVAGFGEFVGYALRLGSGYLVDKTKRHWSLMFVGYFCNLLVVPLLAIASNAGVAAMLIIVERLGKGIRIPARDAMLSYAGQSVGMGKSFGIHEAMDKLGATLGPLIVAALVLSTNGYRASFAALLVPAILALLFLGYTYRQFPRVDDLDLQSQQAGPMPFHYDRLFLIYLLGAGLVGAGYADFALIAYHLEKVRLFSPVWIPLIYALIMGVSSLTSPFLGRLYDCYGAIILLIVMGFSILAVPFLFLGGPMVVVCGAVLWGLGMSGLGPVMRAIVAHLVVSQHRGSAYGIFNLVFGLFWFVGSVIMGFLYDYSILALVIFSVFLQLLALPCFWKAKRALLL